MINACNVPTASNKLVSITENVTENEWKHLYKIHYLGKLNKYEKYDFEMICQRKLIIVLDNKKLTNKYDLNE